MSCLNLNRNPGPIQNGETGAVDLRYPFGYVRRYGSIGDGIADDTAAIQSALDSGAVNIYGDPQDTYLISFTGTTSVGGYRYCLLQHSGQKIDFRGATLKRADGANAIMLTHERAYWAVLAEYDDGMELKNAVFEGNSANNPWVNSTQGILILYYNTTNLKVENITCSDFISAGLSIIATTNSYINNIKATNGTATGIKLDYFDKSFADNLYVESIVEESNEGNQGNPYTLSGILSCFGRLAWKDCDWECKIQSSNSRETTDMTFEALNGDGSGVKFEGYSTTYPVSRITINSINVKNSKNSASLRGGLYFYQAYNISINSYMGYENGVTDPTGVIADSYEMHFHTCDNIIIHAAHITTTKLGVIFSRRTNALRWHIGLLNLIDPCAKANAGYIINHQGGQGSIDRIRHYESRSPNNYIYNYIYYQGLDSTDMLDIGSIRTNININTNQGGTQLGTVQLMFNGTVTMAGVFRIGHVLCGTNPTYDSSKSLVTLNSAGADTVIANANIVQMANAGFFFRPCIRIVLKDVNSASMAQLPYPTYSQGYNSATPGFTITHPVAPANTYIKYEAGPWELGAN